MNYERSPSEHTRITRDHRHSEKCLGTLITSKLNRAAASRNPCWNCRLQYWKSSTRPGGTRSATPPQVGDILKAMPDRVNEDQAYQNAKMYSDRQNV